MFKAVEQTIDFPAMERNWLSVWYKNGIVASYLRKNDTSNKYFSFMDGPITANNPMGIHHAWGRTYKDLWQKFFNHLGYRERFQNGFDCQGLWVEVEVEKELGFKTKKDIENVIPGDRKASIAKFVELCKARVIKFSGIQTEQTKRLGNFMDWDHSYFTMSDENNYMIWHFLKKCFEHGWIYKGHESVPWCPRCETAISQHEMLTEDYKEVVHESIYFALPIEGRTNEYLLVWTTTPWTLPANIAVAVDKKLDYSLVKVPSGRAYWVAQTLVKSLFNEKEPHIIKTVKGSELVGLRYRGMFDHLEAVKKVADDNKKNFHTVVATDDTILPILTTEGTGLVHTAVSAGTEDFKLGKKLGLPMIPVIADNADYLPGLGQFSGKNAKKNPRVILDYLVESDKANNTHFVFKIHNYKHRYPACWRCKKELVWKVADEWYISMDLPSRDTSSGTSHNHTLRERMMEVAKKITWMPSFGLERELDWLKNMHDWLISKKNRYWGLALPIYECHECGTFEVLGSKSELKSRAVEGWSQFEGKSPHKPFIDDVYINCKKCGKKTKRIDDVGNPWLDAGIVPFSTIAHENQGEPLYLKNKEEWKNWFPADFITESFPGQFKNWFYALIAEATVLENTNPFKRVLGFASCLGEDGRPMHKSWGNAIEFNEGADKIGVDVIRWMFARHNPAENMLFGYKRADEVRRQFYLMLWNVYKYFVEYANLDKWEKNKNAKPTNILDKWIESRFMNLVKTVEASMKEYNAKTAAIETEKFVSDVSTWYLRRSRDRVYVNSEDSKDKDSFYSTFYNVLVNLSIVLSSFMPFISEEMYVNLTGEKSVHLTGWPTVDEALIDVRLEKEMEMIRTVAEAGHAWRKKNQKKVRVPLAKIEVDVENMIDISDEVWEILLKELNVKNIVVNKTNRYPKKEVAVTEEELQREGEVRELIREIQGKRKEMGLVPSQKIRITIPSSLKQHATDISKKVVAKEVQFGETVKVEI